MRKSGARETRLLLFATLKRRRATTAEGTGWQGGCAEKFAIFRRLARGIRPRADANKKPGLPQGKPGSSFSALAGVDYLSIEATTPAPTVRPPSRIVNRWPMSIAIGAISFTPSAMLSPGITISVPSGSSIVPVTSVVRK